MDKLMKSATEVNQVIALAIILFELDEMDRTGRNAPTRSFLNSGGVTSDRVARAVDLYNQAKAQ